MTFQTPFSRAVAGFAAAPGSGGDGGPATLASLFNPTGVAVDTGPNAGLFITGEGGQVRYTCQVSVAPHIFCDFYPQIQETTRCDMYGRTELSPG